MTLKRRTLLTVVLGAAGATLLPATSEAWVPPGDFLVGKIAERRKGMKSVHVKGIRTFVGRSFEGGKMDVAEEVWATTEGDFRLERKTPKGDYLEVSDGKKRVTLEDGKPGAQEVDPHPLEQLLLYNAGKDDLLKSAQAFGIKTDIASLGRLDISAPGGDAAATGAAVRVCWVIGGKEGDKDAPLLWIDKDRNFPLQLDDPKTKKRVRFEGWGEGVGAGLMPARVSVWHGDDLEQDFKITEAKINPKLAADLFKPDTPVIATPTPTPSATPKPTPTAAPAATPKPKPKPTPKPKTRPKSRKGSGT